MVRDVSKAKLVRGSVIKGKYDSMELIVGQAYYDSMEPIVEQAYYDSMELIVGQAYYKLRSY